jgi:hypothetical protein
MTLENTLAFLEKTGRTLGHANRANDRRARIARRSLKEVRVRAAAAACGAANRNPTASKGHLEEAARRVPKSHMIVLVPETSGVKRAMVIPKRARKEFLGA